MSEDQRERIERIIENGYNFNLGSYVSQGFDLLKKNLGGFILFTVLFFAISVIVSMVPVIGAFIGSLVVTPVLTVGFYLVARKIDLGETTELGDFFKGWDYVKELVLTALVMGAIIVASLIPFFLAAGTGFFSWILEAQQNPADLRDFPYFPFWSLILILPAVFLSIAYSWSYLFVVFYKMSFWDAMESSRKLISQKWFTFLIFFIALGLIAAAGFILLCVGILASIPAIYCMQYAAFKDVTQLGAEDEGGNDYIEKHLVN